MKDNTAWLGKQLRFHLLSNLRFREERETGREGEIVSASKILISTSPNEPLTKMSNSRLNLSWIFLHLFISQFMPGISAIRKDIGFQENPNCRNTVQGRYLLSDDNVCNEEIFPVLHSACYGLAGRPLGLPQNYTSVCNGRVCDALSLDPHSRCCPGKGEKYSCHGCNILSRCCNSYEFCVSCCLNPAWTKKEQVLKLKVAKQATAGTYTSVFDFCAGRCRHNSESVVHENAYLSAFHHCFSLPSNSSAAASNTHFERRLNGINVILGRQSESCESVCKSNGQSCVLNKLLVLNQCDIMQKYMNCKGACLSSVGADQPAEVVDDAPKDLNPGACLFTRTQSMLSCDGSHPYTRRLCPCA